jgi:hypothetical protein
MLTTLSPQTVTCRKWSIDLNAKDIDSSSSSSSNTLPLPLGIKKVSALEKALQSRGRKTSTEVSVKEKQRAEMIVRRKQSMAMSLATGPGKSILMNAFMMYMSGSQLNMWSITIVSGAILSPLKSIMAIHKTFARFEDPGGKVDLNMPKLVYFILNMIWLGVGLFKMSKMRLLPTMSSDYAGTILWKEMDEITSIPPL